MYFLISQKPADKAVATFSTGFPHKTTNQPLIILSTVGSVMGLRYRKDTCLKRGGKWQNKNLGTVTGFEPVIYHLKTA